ncbi:NADH-ubiquinone oxidoreductase subunit [Chrysochromulina tobinii]|uniref:NADH dehydrogenase [ubiquinone] 1 alpha subcomplex subunit 13 n=1 Tax=Chrysochromulina tobinii TaxID=1460289 RepID=A0A0M0J417_9EUKA|nr:NADH-ubiquinone oxidoreductase subunit [Chrysochromulina tobinii]|eukprot:KOO20963.1 NADH-ubiquinone oxidoreductase subunit [Chrysochromulina sp. CCMP291]
MRWTRPLFASAGPKTPGNFVQDGPPPGGFPAVKIQRSLPAGGLSSVALMSGLVLTFTYGMYQIIAANRQRRQARRAFEAGSALQLLRALAFNREELDIRMAVLPFLTAESDVKAAFIKSKMLENEAELMKDVPNWEAGASVYKTRYMSPMEVFGVR